MENKTRIDETNNMRNLMGLNVFTEDKSQAQIDTDEKEAKDSDIEAVDDQSAEGFKSDKAAGPDANVGTVIGVDQNIKDDVTEDSEGEETYNYGDDEGHDRGEEEHLEDEEKMAPEDRIAEIERHLDALKKDMGYDEDHEDRDEEGTHFAEGKTFKIKRDGKIITLTEGDIKKINKKILK